MKIAALSTVVIYDIICKADVVIAAEDDDTEGSLTMNLLLSIIQHHWYHHISIFFFLRASMQVISLVNSSVENNEFSLVLSIYRKYRVATRTTSSRP